MAGFRMGKFKEKCKKLLSRSKAEPSDDKEPTKPRIIRKLWKKKSKTVSSATTSETLVNTPPTDEATEDPSASSVDAVNEAAVIEDHPCVKASVSPLNMHSEEPITRNEPAPTEQPSAENTTPAKHKTSSSSNRTPNVSPDSPGPSSSYTSSELAPPAPGVYELPDPFTYQDATTQPALNEEEPASLDDAKEKEERSKGEAKYWGTTVSTTYVRQLDDPFRDFGMVAPSGPVPNDPGSSILDVTTADASGILERDIGSETASVAKLPGVSQILHGVFGLAEEPGNGSLANTTTNLQDPAIKLPPIRSLTCVVEPTSHSQTSNAAFDGRTSLTRILGPDTHNIIFSATSPSIDDIPEEVDHPASDSLAEERPASPASDDVSVKSHFPSVWERAFASRESTHRNELQDLREDHAAEVKTLKEQVEAVKKRKEYVEKMAREKLGAKDKEIAARNAEIVSRNSELDVVYSDNSDKEIEIAEMRITIKQLTADNLRQKEQVSFQEDSSVSLIAFPRKYNELCQMYNKLWNMHNELKELAMKSGNQIVAPLIKEMARLAGLSPEPASSGVLEQVLKPCSIEKPLSELRNELRKRLDTRQDYAALQNDYQQVCDERAILQMKLDDVEEQLQDSNQLYNRTIAELADAKRDIMTKNMKIWEQGYAREEAEESSRNANNDASCKRCPVLEKKANETFQLWRDDTKRHEEEKLRLQIKADENQAQVYDLQGHINKNKSELARLTRIVERFLKDHAPTRAGSRLVSILQELLDASKQTVAELKEKIEGMQNQITQNEKETIKAKLTLRARESILKDKDAEIKEATDAKANAEKELEKLDWRHDMQTLALKDEINTLESELADKDGKVKHLERHVHSMFDAGFGKLDPETQNLHQAEVHQLQERNTQLETENRAHRDERAVQRQRDFHAEQCAGGCELTMAAMSQNYANAHEEIARLKRAMALLHQGCDPEKFEIAKELSALREEHAALKRY
ncbi:MAG: hypothetical protein LQ352_005214, partial [Teloschistes flavicans]